MEIAQLTSSAAAASDAAPKKTLGKDEFLKLLTMQLRYQNPLNPMNNTEFTSQLAQLSSLEALNHMVKQMSDMLLYQNSIQNTLTLNLIGKNVKFSGNQVALKDKGEISYNLAANASKVTISVYDSSGKLIRKIEAGQQNAGANNYVWDGKDSSGNKMPDGSYTYKVEAADASGKPVEVATTSRGQVTGVAFENNTTYIVIDGKIKLKLNEILEIC
jgi:flagellar basal-body rod modification protein FlgD